MFIFIKGSEGMKEITRVHKESPTVVSGRMRNQTTLTRIR